MNRNEAHASLALARDLVHEAGQRLTMLEASSAPGMHTGELAVATLQLASAEAMAAVVQADAALRIAHELSLLNGAIRNRL